MPIKSYKDLTLEHTWGKEYCGKENQAPNLEQLTFGLMVRIAEALEALATGKATGEMARELGEKEEQLKKKQDWIQHKNERIQYLERSRAAHKGIIAKLKKGRGA